MQKNILFVEDNAGDILLTREAMAYLKLPYSISFVRNVQDAWAFLRKEGKFSVARRPDIIFLDLNLPGILGKDFLRSVKSDPHFMTIPVIVLSTSSSEQDVRSSYALQANSYITKPVDYEVFLQILRVTCSFWLETVRLAELPDGVYRSS